MGKPLWRYALHVVFAALAAQRAIGAHQLHILDQHRGLVIGFGLQAVVAACVAVALLLSRFEVGTLTALGIVMLATTLLASVVAGGAAWLSLTKGLVAVLCIAGIIYLLRRESRESREP